MGIGLGEVAVRKATLLAARAAGAAWPAVRKFNERFERPAPKPAWAPGPLLKRRELRDFTSELTAIPGGFDAHARVEATKPSAMIHEP